MNSFQYDRQSIQSVPNLINIRFSDDCFHLLFSYFPIHTLLSLRSVCKRWKTVIEDIFKKKQSLKLFGSIGSIDCFVENVANLKISEQIHFPKIIDFNYDGFLINTKLNSGRHASIVLASLFPNVKRLVINCPQLMQQPNVPLIRLLYRWRFTLCSIILYSLPSNCDQLWRTLQHCSSLKHLCAVRFYRTIIPETFSLLPQMESFGLAHYLLDPVPILSQLKSCYALKLSWISINRQQIETIIELNSNLTFNLRKLCLGLLSTSTLSSSSSSLFLSRIDNFRQVLTTICNRFQHLTFLDILMSDQLPFEELLLIISRLTSLNELWIYVGRHQLEDWNDNNNNNRYDEMVEKIIIKRKQLHSIRKLYVEIYDLSLEQFRQSIAYRFPNVEHLTVKMNFSFDSELNSKIRMIEFEQLIRSQFKYLIDYHLKK